jgi:hypothetical protein
LVGLSSAGQYAQDRAVDPRRGGRGRLNLVAERQDQRHAKLGALAWSAAHLNLAAHHLS